MSLDEFDKLLERSFNFVEDDAAIKELLEKNDELLEKNKKLKERLSLMKREKEIQESRLIEILNRVGTLKSENMTLNQDIKIS